MNAPITIEIHGAVGGAGVTTLAAQLTVHAQARGMRPTHTATAGPADQDDLDALVGGPINRRPGATADPEGAALTIVDGGTVGRAATGRTDEPTARLLVLPATYAALRRVLRTTGPDDYDGAVVVDYPKRPLSSRDVGAIVDVPVLGSITRDAETARASDAGTLALSPMPPRTEQVLDAALRAATPARCR